MSWAVHRATGSAATFHQRPLEEPLERTVHVWEVDRPALVLGSAQPDTVVDRGACASAGVEVVRRRSGGGAVLLDPGATVWVDVELPRTDPLWRDDIGRAAWWLGECWAAALGDPGVGGAVVHRGPMVTTEWSPLVCFAGLGPGEVTAGLGGPKVLGLSQRRTRAGARFQCAVNLRWESGRLAGLVDLPEAHRERLAGALDGAVHVVTGSPHDVVNRLLFALP